MALWGEAYISQERKLLASRRRRSVFTLFGWGEHIVLPDQQSAFLEYLVGSFDLLPNIDPSFKDDLLTKSGAARGLHGRPYLRTQSISKY